MTRFIAATTTTAAYVILTIERKDEPGTFDTTILTPQRTECIRWFAFGETIQDALIDHYNALEWALNEYPDIPQPDQTDYHPMIEQGMAQAGARLDA